MDSPRSEWQPLGVPAEINRRIPVGLQTGLAYMEEGSIIA